MSAMLSVMQMQYFKVIKQGFSVRPPPWGKDCGSSQTLFLATVA